MKAPMDLILLLLFCFFSNQTAFSAGHEHSDSPGVHGMAVVGTEKIYLSHLPMFHSPHDYQILLEVEFDSLSLAAYNKSHSTFNETVYTISPEVFVLPERAHAGKTFRAELFRGHFERGGVLIADQVTVTIVRVLYLKKFLPGEVQPNEAKYLLFGNESEQFLAHAITSKPDFDQILSVKADEVAGSILSQGSGVVVLTLINQKNDEPLIAPRSIQAKTEGDLNPFELKVFAELYLETGDLL